MSTEGDKARALAEKLGISVTRARRAIILGVEEEARQYAETHKKEIAAEKKRARAAAYHDKLYAEAMDLAADADDMDVVEHHCQGSIARLKEFIASRTERQNRLGTITCLKSSGDFLVPITDDNYDEYAGWFHGVREVYDDERVLVPLVHFAEVAQFAERFGIRLSDGAKRRIAEMKK